MHKYLTYNIIQQKLWLSIVFNEISKSTDWVYPFSGNFPLCTNPVNSALGLKIWARFIVPTKATTHKYKGRS